MNRIQNTNKSFIDRSKLITDALMWLQFNEVFTPEVEKYRLELRKVLEEKVKHLIPSLVEKAEFPEEVIPVLRELKIGEKYCNPPYGIGQNTKYLFAIMLELARIDASLATLVFVHLAGLANSIDDYGSEEQKLKLLPKILNFDLIGG
jgi:alkylation response protein AidB-like acyl-CoA dehydrogenase